MTTEEIAAFWQSPSSNKQVYDHRSEIETVVDTDRKTFAVVRLSQHGDVRMTLPEQHPHVANYMVDCLLAVAKDNVQVASQ